MLQRLQMHGAGIELALSHGFCTILLCIIRFGGPGPSSIADKRSSEVSDEKRWNESHCFFPTEESTSERSSAIHHERSYDFWLPRAGRISIETVSNGPLNNVLSARSSRHENSYSSPPAPRRTRRACKQLEAALGGMASHGRRSPGAQDPRLQPQPFNPDPLANITTIHQSLAVASASWAISRTVACTVGCSAAGVRSKRTLIRTS